MCFYVLVVLTTSPVARKKKREKDKEELIRLISLMNSFAVSAHGSSICLLEFAIVLKLKNNKKRKF